VAELHLGGRYLDAANGTKHMHYYLQFSEGDPKTDPITLCEAPPSAKRFAAACGAPIAAG
jgi:hypothetical protein